MKIPTLLFIVTLVYAFGLSAAYTPARPIDSCDASGNCCVHKGKS